MDFPSFLEGLSLRQSRRGLQTHPPAGFPFLFGRAFIEAGRLVFAKRKDGLFPFLFGRAFIEAGELAGWIGGRQDFPSFLEGLSLRHKAATGRRLAGRISLPFWKGFH